MKRIWLVTVVAIRDSLHTLWGIPFLVFGILAANFIMLMGFGYQLEPNPYADNIISSHFLFLAMGIWLGGLVLGALSMPRERRARVMFTLPISRMQIVLGKLLGNQIVVGGGLLIAYGISRLWASHFNLTEFSHSWLGLATAFSLSFTYLCLAIPLGYWMPPFAAALWAWLIVFVPGILKDMAEARLVTSGWIVKPIELLAKVIPGQLETKPLSKAFWNVPVSTGDYLAVMADVFLAFAFFMLLSALAHRKELSTKSHVV
jgi:hypothetical protein